MKILKSFDLVFGGVLASAFAYLVIMISGQFVDDTVVQYSSNPIVSIDSIIDMAIGLVVFFVVFFILGIVKKEWKSSVIVFVVVKILATIGYILFEGSVFDYLAIFFDNIYTYSREYFVYYYSLGDNASFIASSVLAGVFPLAVFGIVYVIKTHRKTHCVNAKNKTDGI